MSEEDVQVVRRAWEASDRRDTAALFALYDPAIVWQSHYGPISGSYHGHDGVRQFFREWTDALDAFRAHADECRWFDTGTAPTSSTDRKEMSQENIAVVYGLADALRRGDRAAALAALDTDVQWHDQAAIPGAGVHRGREAVSRHFDQWFDAWREIDYTAEEVLDDGDSVLVVVRRSGRGKGSGAEVADHVVHAYTVRNDKIVSFEAFSDRGKALEAVGLRE
ncbi:MAG: nuclear transport factor 2 family protein [Aeromicrobium sp.]